MKTLVTGLNVGAALLVAAAALGSLFGVDHEPVVRALLVGIAIHLNAIFIRLGEK